MATLYRCIACNSTFDEHQPVCTGCFRVGQLLPVPRRSYAAADHQPGIATAKSLSRMTFHEIDQTVCPGLRLGVKSMVVIEGHSGKGKSSLAARLANSVAGPTVLSSVEESIGPALASRLARCGVRSEDFIIVSRASVDQIIQISIKAKAKVLVVDSVVEAVWRPEELRHALEIIPTLDLLLAVSQVNKAGEPLGRNALIHECDVQIHCAEMRWSLRKSRFQDLNGVGGDVLPPQAERGDE